MAFGSWHGRGGWHRRLRWVVGHLNQGVHVEDEADPAIAKNCAAGQQILLPESVAETLDHDFLFTEKLVHQQTPGRVAGFDNDHYAILGFDRPRSSPKIVT
jgi:hypothetical protein